MKKTFKKSIAFVIAALMIFSTLPLTPPISVEAADDISFTGYTAANPTPLFSGSQSTETNMKKLKGTFWDNILWTSSTGSQAAVNPTITGTDGSQVATFYAKNTVLLLDGKTVPKMPVMYGNRTYYWFNGNATTATVYPTAGTDSTEDNTEIYLINKNNTDSSLDWKGGSGAKSQDFYYCRDSLSTYIGSSASNPNNRKGNNFTDGWTNRDWAHYASALMVDDSTINFNGAYSKKFNLTWHVKVVSSKRNTGPWEANITATNHNIYVVNYKPVLTLLGQIPTSTEYTNISNNNNYYTPATQTRYMNAVKALAGLNPNTYFTGKTDDTVGQAVSDCEKAIKDAITEYNQAKESLVHEHSYTSQVTTQPTCTTAGVTTYTCACGDSYTDDKTPGATGHSYNYTYNNNSTHKKVCKNCNKLETEPCTNELMNEGTTSDTWHCTLCLNKYEREVVDMSALKEAIVQLEALVNADDAAYKYEATALEAAKEAVANAKAYAENKENRYAEPGLVDIETDKVLTAETNLKKALAKYSQTFIIKKDDGKGNTTELKTFTQGYENLAYGSTVEFSDYTIPTIEDENSTLNGLPMYAVYKWVKIVNGVEQKLAATDVQISDVVKGETTYICYVLDFKATDDTQKTTRVRYLDKSGNTIEFDTAKVGSTYVPKDSVKYPNLPYYVFDYWECVFGTPENVGTREIVFKAKYKYDETTLANQCTIQGFGNVKVNGKSSCSATYDSKVTLTGATKYAFCDEKQNIISYINNDYIYTPHVNNEIVYIIGVEEEEAKKATTAITGSFVQKNAGKLDDGETDYHNLYVNAQYYLPEGTKAVEAGIVISKSKNTEDDLQIGKTGVTKLMSDTQSPNHEYSMAMSFVNPGSINVRSYLICVDGSGNTYTVYSAVKTIAYSA